MSGDGCLVLVPCGAVPDLLAGPESSSVRQRYRGTDARAFPVAAFGLPSLYSLFAAFMTLSYGRRLGLSRAASTFSWVFSVWRCSAITTGTVSGRGSHGEIDLSCDERTAYQIGRANGDQPFSSRSIAASAAAHPSRSPLALAQYTPCHHRTKRANVSAAD